jgi:hypothetical protein
MFVKQVRQAGSLSRFVKEVRQGGFMTSENRISKERTSEERQLSDLVSIGSAMLRDFELLNVRTVAQLARRNPEKMYEKLCQVTGQAQDICCLDVFRAAVAQAKNPNLPIEQRLWWQWSRKRKASHASR